LRQKRSVGEYLAFLTIKYGVDPGKFFAALLAATEQEKSECDGLIIEYRGEIGAKKIFLMKNTSGVIAQFRIPNEFLLGKGNPLKNFMETDMVRKHLSKKTKPATSNFIKDLRAGMSHVNLRAKVLEVEETKHVFTRYGNPAIVAKVLIGDETGTIKLCLWNGQINSVSVGDTVHIENAQASMFRGEKQLSLGKKGTLNNEVFKPQLASVDLPTVTP
jgi:replication factor A1